jgi:hypothetical protein
MDTGLATPESHVRDLHDRPLSGRKKGASVETPWGCSSGSVRWSITMSRGAMTQRGRRCCERR